MVHVIRSGPACTSCPKSMNHKAMKFFLVIVVFVCSLPAYGQGFKGDIVGKVLDSKTLEPIPSVNVIVLQKQVYAHRHSFYTKF